MRDNSNSELSVPADIPSPGHWREGYEHGRTGQPYKAYGGRPKAISYGQGYQAGKRESANSHR